MPIEWRDLEWTVSGNWDYTTVEVPHREHAILIHRVARGQGQVVTGDNLGMRMVPIGWYDIAFIRKGGDVSKPEDYPNFLNRRLASGGVLEAMCWLHAYQTTEPFFPLPEEVT